MATWVPTYLNNLSTANYGMWNSPAPGLHPDGSITPGEGGVDIGTPNGTPVYAIADGPVIASGQWQDSAHQVVTQRVSVPGAGTQDLYYQHIQIDPSIHTGDQLKRGQLIGTIGPYNEIEMGFNAQWGGIWGDNHPGPWVKDPRPWLNALLSGNGAAPLLTGGSMDTSNSGGSGLFGSYTAILQKLPGGLTSIPLIIGALVITAIGLGAFLIYKEIN